MEGRTLKLLALLASAIGLYIYSRTQQGSVLVASAAQSIGDLLTPRGVRNNNPGNIRRSTINWHGQLTEAQVQGRGWTWDANFIQFDRPEDGIRALGHVLLSYAGRGIDNVQQIISTYAPGTENDTASYITDVSNQLAVMPSQLLDVTHMLPVIAAAIITHENGQQPYAPDMIQTAVYS